MSSIEIQLKLVEDRLALQELIHSYCIHIDEGRSMDAIANCFTEDAVLDLSELGLPVVTGRKTPMNLSLVS